MNPKCRCGGRFRSTDFVVPVVVEGRTLYDTRRRRKGHASWRCDSCGKTQTQRLHQPGSTRK